MNYQFAFEIFEKVKIQELEQTGIVICIFIDSSLVQYKVRYFHNGEAKEIYFLERELKKL